VIDRGQEARARAETRASTAEARTSTAENRVITIGFLDDTMVVLVWTPRRGAHRVVSMRKANEKERERYRDRLGGS